MSDLLLVSLLHVPPLLSTPQILKDTQVTRQALNEISARHSEIQQLERSIRELHEIFTFLATEVEMQASAPRSRLGLTQTPVVRPCLIRTPAVTVSPPSPVPSLPEAFSPLQAGPCPQAGTYFHF